MAKQTETIKAAKNGEAAIISGGLVNLVDLEAKLVAAEKAKDSQFVEGMTDFWKPTEDGATLKGIYLGCEKSGQYLQHAVAIRNPKTGRPFTMRFNGTRVLTKLLDAGEPGQAVKIVFDGQEKTEPGERNAPKLFTVSWLDV